MVTLPFRVTLAGSFRSTASPQIEPVSSLQPAEHPSPARKRIVCQQVALAAEAMRRFTRHVALIIVGLQNLLVQGFLTVTHSRA